MNNIKIKNYGIMILKKDSILYHTSEVGFVYLDNIEKPFLFCSFHPIDYEGLNTEYIHIIKLKRDIKLFFMIDDFILNKYRKIIFSAFSHFFISNKKNLSQINKTKILEFSQKLKLKKFDGWFSSIEDGSGIEVALINDKDIYELLQSNNFNSNWNIGNNLPMNLGLKYNICTTYKPLTIIINKKFKQKFEMFYNIVKNKNFIVNNIFEKILSNAIIIYMDDNNNENSNAKNIINKYISNI
jgi:hypothetical protein